MSEIFVKVMLAEDNSIGIPNLLAEVYDDNEDDGVGDILPRPGRTDRRLSNNTLISSGITDENGEVVISFDEGKLEGSSNSRSTEPGQSRSTSARAGRPRISLIVRGPDSVDQESQHLYDSGEVRQSAGERTSFIIKITNEQLKSANIPLPKSEPDEIIELARREYEKQSQIEQGLQAIRAQSVSAEREKTRQYKERFQAQFEGAISRHASESIGSSRFVDVNESIAKISSEVIKNNIENVVNNAEARPPMHGHIVLTDEQKEKLFANAPQDGDGNFIISAADIEPILYQSQNGSQHSTVFLNDDPMANFCRERTQGEKCLIDGDDDNDDADSDPGSDPPGVENGSVLTSEDIPAYVSRLTGNLSSPENPVIFGMPPEGIRADEETIRENIGKFLLREGPAENPSFYEFHNLQIAFDHVWQEVIDNGLLALAEYAYKQIVGSGGDPDLISNSPKDPVQALKQEAELVIHGQTGNTYAARGMMAAPHIGIGGSDQFGQEGVTGPITVVPPVDFYPGDFDIPNNEAEAVPPKPAGNPWNRLHAILRALEARLKEPYSFTAFGADGSERSINFGNLITYRQKWDPVSYQAGELAKTITLAPKEVRKFSTKTIFKKKRMEKEIDSSLRSVKDESSQTSRAEADILRKAQNKTNFNLTTEGSFDIFLYDGKATTSFTKDAQSSSEDKKNEFRESILKSAQEYKRERKLEVNAEESFESESMDSGEIMNPNDELPVTFLFYELQRRFKLSERIHRLTPVILVAHEIPKPHEIDEDWLLAHDWILNRVLLDDSFRPTLGYLSDKVVGDEYALKETFKNVKQQRTVVDVLKEQIEDIRSRANQRYADLLDSIEKRAKTTQAEEADGFLTDIGEFFTGSGLSPEAARIREEAARDAYERAVQQEKELMSRLQGEISSLNTLTESYTARASEHLNRRVQIARLQVHVKENIIYYMQAIWLHEHDDQRFMRLHSVQVPVLEGQRTYTVNPTPSEDALCSLPELTEEELTCHPFDVSTELNTELQFKTLEQVADIDELLGFKGNYMIFPLKESNAITDYMMAPYVDSAFGLHDPDEFGNMTLDEFSEYVCCLKKRLGDDFGDEIKAQLKTHLKKLLTSPLRNNEEITIPTDSLYIEALPGAHPILEDFKLIHRAIDVKKVQAEVRDMELENLRMAARILDENFEDPDIDKKIVVQGNGASVSLQEGDS